MAIGVLDELPMQLLGLFALELLAALRALEGPRHLDPHVLYGAIPRLGLRADLHSFRHCSKASIQDT